MRYINTARATAAYHRELLDFYVAELLAARSTPGTIFYLISPWLSDFDFILERRGYLTDLLPGQTRISLEGLLTALLETGSRLRIAALCPGANPERDDAVIKTVGLIRRLWQAHPAQVEVRFFSDLHTKLFIGQVSALHGSANSTYMATFVNKELLTYAVAPDELLALRQEAFVTFTAAKNRVQEKEVLERVTHNP